MQPLLEVRNLVKSYPKVQAVRGVSFRVAEGSCFGILGPNGAGKTTTVEMMEGVTEPTSGEVLFKGKPRDSSYAESIGVQFQETSLPDFLTVEDVLKLFKSLYKKTFPLDQLAKLCSLEDYWKRDAKKLSGGQRQRLHLAVALINDPDLVFLDEPTTGLDPQARRNFWELVKSIKARNKTIILTTHYMEEAFYLCDEITIMDHGKIIAEGTPQNLLNKHFEGVFLTLPKEDVTVSLSELGLEGNELEDSWVIRTTRVNETLQHLIEKGVSLARMNLRSATLEDLFIELTGKAMRD